MMFKAKLHVDCIAGGGITRLLQFLLMESYTQWKKNNNKVKDSKTLHPHEFLGLEFLSLPILPPALLSHLYPLTDGVHKP